VRMLIRLPCPSPVVIFIGALWHALIFDFHAAIARRIQRHKTRPGAVGVAVGITVRDEAGCPRGAGDFLQLVQVGAQVAISTINTILTAVFLHAMGFPFKNFLILTTFVCGLIPIIGNVISNIAIVSAGLTISVQLATFGLGYLVVIHKLEYILNSRIVGSSIDTPMWMTLLGLIVGEAMMGVPGVLLAPALLHYVRAELRAIPTR